MNVVCQTPPQPTPLAGIAHATWAGQADGPSGLSLWRQTLASPVRENRRILPRRL